MKQLLFLFVGLVLSMPLFASNGLKPVETERFNIESITLSANTSTLMAEVEVVAPMACSIIRISACGWSGDTQYCTGGSHGTLIQWVTRISNAACRRDMQ